MLPADGPIVHTAIVIVGVIVRGLASLLGTVGFIPLVLQQDLMSCCQSHGITS